MNAVLIILLSCLSLALSLDFVRLTDDCLRGRSLQGNENLRCVTPKGLIVQHMIEDSQTFYCLKYEKKSGNKNEFDVLSFDLHEDYDLKFVSRCVCDSLWQLTNSKYWNRLAQMFSPAEWPRLNLNFTTPDQDRPTKDDLQSPARTQLLKSTASRSVTKIKSAERMGIKFGRLCLQSRVKHTRRQLTDHPRGQCKQQHLGKWVQ